MRPRRRYEESINVGLKEMVYEGMEWIQLTYDSVQWLDFVYIVPVIKVLSIKGEEFPIAG
jgi:hypothetical protein